MPSPPSVAHDRSNGLWPGESITHGFERGVLSALQLLLMVLILLAVLDLVWLLWRGATTTLVAIDSVEELRKALQRGFAGILLVLIGLELLETLRAYLHDHNVRLEAVLVVAVIALGRHIIQIDLEHMNGLSMIGVAALVLALAIGYFLVRWMARFRRESVTPMSGINPKEG